ncbi:sensor histidine kinase [Paractinoplanes lichenicola]|uniref:histidine kinase n=1 Tax=Paractinoplanes lichenicola TaxID=2802976 RepID=A0ABS1VT91_9ACTN|nr:histidine kinase [Actinoplanes lichenicola]MBL7257686.1 sensor histidine kinase [Actinoplanes lichenicola]
MSPDAPPSERDAPRWAGRVEVLPARVVDVGLGALAVVGVGLAALDGVDAGLGAGLLAAEIAGGVLSVLALPLRRSRPVVFAAVTGVLSVCSLGAAIVSLIALCTVAARRRLPVALGVVASYAVLAGVSVPVRPDMSHPDRTTVVIGVLAVAVVLAWGMYVRTRHDLLASLRERAEHAEADQERRFAQARQAERARIAHEMHDVLAHRISLLSLHAGALQLRPDTPPEKIAQAAGVIRDSAHQVLEDVREVLGVLRPDAVSAPAPSSAREATSPSGQESFDGWPGGTGTPEPPQPDLRMLPALVEESRLADMSVALRFEVRGADAVPGTIGRAVYRIVQEALTNVRKHAPGQPATVTVDGAQGLGLTVTVTNAVATAGGSAAGGGGGVRAEAGDHGEPGRVGGGVPGSGLGLIGMSERAAVAGGRLEYGSIEGSFRLSAWLPW